MEEIIKTYKQTVPAMRFIGKKYNAAGGDWGNYGEWFGNDWFGIIEKAAGGAETVHQLYEDGDAYINMLLRNKDSNPLEFWIGMFVALGTEVPDGFLSMDFPAQNLGICWIYGNDIQFYKILEECKQKIKDEGLELHYQNDGSYWALERDCCPRYTTPDEKGNIIADYCFFIK